MPAPLQWQPTREGYLQFLAESRLLFQTLEDIMAEAPHPDCAPLVLGRHCLATNAASSPKTPDPALKTSVDSRNLLIT